jgi:AraC-like DNA-binding protein
MATIAERRQRYDLPPPLEIIPPHPQYSFRSLTHDYPSPICGWGHHPEYEIHLIRDSTGSFIAGDHIGTFTPGQVTLMGPNLPHDWVSDLEPGVVILDRDAVIQFTDEWIRELQRHMPELLGLNAVLQKSKRGLLFSGESARVAAEGIMNVVRTEGVTQLAHLFTVLAAFAAAPDHERTMLASEWHAVGDDSDPAGRNAVEAGLSYIFENLTGDIRLSVAAKLAYMSEPTFSKYFKKASGTTFSDMVKKLRIAHARRLLDSSDLPISEVAAESGYRNLANFNRQFLAEVGMTPTAYRKLDSSLKPPTEVLALGRKAQVSWV